MNVLARLTFFVLLVGAIAAIVWANGNRDLGKLHFQWKLQATPALDVQLAKATRANIIRSVEAPGEVEADVEVEIASQVMGRILELPVQEGDNVKAGDIVVKLDADEFEAQVRSMKARVDQLKSQIEVSKAELEKSERDVADRRVLVSTRTVSATELKDMETELSKSRARLGVSNAQLEEMTASLVKAQRDLEKTTIRAPVTGVVSRLDAEIGEVVVVGTMNNQGTIIMTISDPKKLIVRASVDETDIPMVKAGQKSAIHLQHGGDETVEGKVIRVSPKGTKGGQTKSSTQKLAADGNSVATFEAIIEILNPTPSVRMGMSANVDIQVTERINAIAIPSRSVLHRRRKDLPPELQAEVEKREQTEGTREDASKRYYQVAFIEKNGRSQCRLIKTGISDDRNIELLGGIEEGETVITGPYRVFDKLTSGREVKPMG
jgi:HlyD family secretion protein